MQKAQSIVTNAQSAKEKGWKAYESNKNRFWIAEELLDPKYSSFTDAFVFLSSEGFRYDV